MRASLRGETMWRIDWKDTDESGAGAGGARAASIVGGS
jgi:hypothetical protein